MVFLHLQSWVGFGIVNTEHPPPMDNMGLEYGRIVGEYRVGAGKY